MSQRSSKLLFTTEEVCLASRLVAENLPIPLEEINNKIKNIKEENFCGNISNPLDSVRRIAQLIHKESLGQEDLFYLLAHPKENLKNPRSSIPMLREALDYPAKDLEKLELSFHTTPFGEDGQVAYIALTPFSIDLNKPPLIFIGGVDHKSALYLSMLSELSKRDRRKIISVDLPSLGGSRLSGNQKVRLANLLETTSQVIQREIPEGKTFDFMAHSLGTLILRKIYFERESYSQKMKRMTGKFILIAPAPAEQEEAMGIHPCWSCSPHLKDNWRETRADREQFAVDLMDSILLFKNIDSLPILGELGKDTNLRVVFPENDHLFPLKNVNRWQGKRGVFIVKGADHSFLAGKEIRKEEVEILLDSLQDHPLDPIPLINRNQLYRHFSRTTILGGLSIDSRAGVGTQLVNSVNHGLWRGDFLGIDFRLGLSVYLHLYDWRKQTPSLWIAPHADLGLKLLNWPLRLNTGALFLMNDSFLVGDVKNENLSVQTYAGIDFSYKMIAIQLQVRQPVWPHSSNFIPPFLFAFLSIDKLLGKNL